VVYYSLTTGVSVCFLVNWRVLLSSWIPALLLNFMDGADIVRLTWSSSVRLFLPRGPGVCVVVLFLKIVFSLPVAFVLPVALCLLALCAFPLVWDSTDGWYSLADASGADDDGVPGSTASSSSRTYASSLARFCVLPVLSTDLSKPLFLVVVDDDVVARLGALRLGGSERVTGKRIDLWIPFGGCVDWRIDSLIASASALPIAPVVKPGIMVFSTTSS
jgi:hypothetical protein